MYILKQVKFKIDAKIWLLNLNTKDKKQLQHLYNWYSKCYYFRDRRINPADYGRDGCHKRSRTGSYINEETIFCSGVAVRIYNFALEHGMKLRFWKLFSAAKRRTGWTSRGLI